MGVTGGGSGGNAPMSQINVTPLVDVMLVLLVIFMVTAPMMDQEEHSEVELDLPQVQDETNRVRLSDVDEAIVRIDGEMKIYLGEELLVDCGQYANGEGANPFRPCFDELQGLVENNRKLQEDGRVFLLADTEIPYGVVVGSMNRIRLAGVEQVGMVTNPQFSDGTSED